MEGRTMNEKEIERQATAMRDMSIEMSDAAKNLMVGMADLTDEPSHVKIGAVLTASAGVFADALATVNNNPKPQTVQLLAMLLNKMVQPELTKLLEHAKRQQNRKED